MSIKVPVGTHASARYITTGAQNTMQKLSYGTWVRFITGNRIESGYVIGYSELRGRYQVCTGSNTYPVHETDIVAHCE